MGYGIDNSVWHCTKFMMKFVSGSGGYSVYYAIFGTVEVEARVSAITIDIHDGDSGKVK